MGGLGDFAKKGDFAPGRLGEKGRKGDFATGRLGDWVMG